MAAMTVGTPPTWRPHRAPAQPVPIQLKNLQNLFLKEKKMFLSRYDFFVI